MTNRYVRSTDGLDTDIGATWDLAKATLAGGAAIALAGDYIYVSQSHAESTAAAISLSLAGTLANPVKIICGSDATEPPADTSTTASITTTGTSSVTVTGSGYLEGINWFLGTGAVVASLNLTGNLANLSFYKNHFTFIGTHTTSKIQCGSQSVLNNSTLRFKDCWVKFGNAGQTISLNLADFKWEGGGLEAGGVSPTYLLTVDSAGSALVDAFDASAGATAMCLCDSTALYAGRVLFRNIKLPAGWTGNIGTVTNASCRIELQNKDLYWLETYFGSVKSSAVCTSDGAKDEGVGYSLKVSSNANCDYPGNRLVTPELPALMNSTIGTPITLEIEIAQDTAAAPLTNAQIGLEVQYLGTTGQVISSFISCGKTNTLADPATHPAGTATWTGLTTPTKQKLSVTFTPAVAGFVQGKIVLTAPSKTVYVDWKLRKAA
jgi:hypothetical protein